LQDSLVSNMKYNDDDFEQLDQLGEGAGGVVHKVKEKQSGRVMARKTITTRETPMKQLLRELNIISSNKHSNIIHFYGAYMSPSTSEIKILMELCEGGSLEAVGKQIKERGAVVGEMIVARLAEGVSRLSTLFSVELPTFLFLGPSGSCLPSLKEDDSPRYQAVEYFAVPRWDCQTRGFWCFRRAGPVDGSHLHRNKHVHGPGTNYRQRIFYKVRRMVNGNIAT